MGHTPFDLPHSPYPCWEEFQIEKLCHHYLALVYLHFIGEERTNSSCIPILRTTSTLQARRISFLLRGEVDWLVDGSVYITTRCLNANPLSSTCTQRRRNPLSSSLGTYFLLKHHSSHSSWKEYQFKKSRKLVKLGNLSKA